MSKKNWCTSQKKQKSPIDKTKAPRRSKWTPVIYRPSKKSHIFGFWMKGVCGWIIIENYGCTFMLKAFPAFVWINSNWLLGEGGKRPILWAGRACLTALIIPAAPAPWLGLDNRLEEGLWAKTMKGEKKIGRAQKQARTTRTFRPKQKHRKTPQAQPFERWE